MVIELIIVFVGVYSAFYLNTYNQEKQEQENRQKVLIALSEEIGDLGKTFGGIASYQAKFNLLVEEKYEQNLDLPEIEPLRFVAPQYSLEVLDNALRSNTFEVLDLALHIELARYYRDTRMLMDVEEKITELSQDYVFLVDASAEAKRKQYSWSIKYLKDRENILTRLSHSSPALVEKIKSRLAQN